MSKQYEEALARFLNGALDTAEKLGEFAKAELPDVVQQALAWHFTYNLIITIFGVAIIVGYVSTMLWMKRRHDACDNHSDKEGWALFMIFGGTITGGAGLILVSQTINLQWLKIWIAPKLWLIEYAASIVGGK